MRVFRTFLEGGVRDHRLHRRPRDDAHAPARRVRLPLPHRRADARRGAGRERDGPRGTLRRAWSTSEAKGDMTTALRRTPLHARHVELGARMVPFAGWEMPVYYVGISEEHRAVRARAGVFDVSHMGQLEVSGDGSQGVPAARAVQRPRPPAHPARRSTRCCTNEQGGIVDDLIAYRLGTDRWLLVVNASNVEADFAHLQAQDLPAAGVELVDRSAELRHGRAAGPRRHGDAGDPVGPRATRRSTACDEFEVMEGSIGGIRCLHRAHGLHRRARRGADPVLGRHGAALRHAAAAAASTASCPAASARGTPCGSRSATRCTATTSRPRPTRSRRGSAGSARSTRTSPARTCCGASRPRGRSGRLVALRMLDRAIPRAGHRAAPRGRAGRGGHERHAVAEPRPRDRPRLSSRRPRRARERRAGRRPRARARRRGGAEAALQEGDLRMAAEESYPDDLRYHPEHDWVRIDGDEAVFGITWYAQDALGEVVYYEPPEASARVRGRRAVRRARVREGRVRRDRAAGRARSWPSTRPSWSRPSSSTRIRTARAG